MRKRLFALSWLLMIGMIVGITACQDEMLSKENFRPEVTLDMERGDLAVFMATGPIVRPVLFNTEQGGNVTCGEAADYFGVTDGFEFSSERVNYEGSFDKPFPVGFDVVTDGTYVSWSFTPPAGYCVVNMVVIVKGGNAANVYYYDSPVYGDSGLVSPDNASGGPAGLSNLTFCYNLEPCNGNGDCWEGETAWTDGPRYTNRGNWATYTPYVAGSTVNIYAGQTYLVGTATFSAVVDGMVTITIALNDDVRLADVKDNVKIQGYGSAPSGNPAPGRFANKFTGGISFEVPAAYFYGVHLDVERKVPCE